MNRCAWLWAAVIALGACSGGGTSPPDRAIMSVGGGKNGVSDGGGSAGRGGFGHTDGGRLGLGGAGGSGAGGAGGFCGSQGASCETVLCCGALRCCSTAATRTCESVCDAS
ncbi:MAG TPA: hypothetical protein VN853_05320 [Polyangia bacterium]|nr:hypothetical protein [Polyangia bacterium]